MMVCSTLGLSLNVNASIVFIKAFISANLASWSANLFISSSYFVTWTVSVLVFDSALVVVYIFNIFFISSKVILASFKASAAVLFFVICSAVKGSVTFSRTFSAASFIFNFTPLSKSLTKLSFFNTPFESLLLFSTSFNSCQSFTISAVKSLYLASNSCFSFIQRGGILL